jgi:hypothetical protein
MTNSVIGEFEDEAIDAIEALVARVTILEKAVEHLKRAIAEEIGDDDYNDFEMD